MEEWRSVIGYEGLYEVSSLGQIVSRPRKGSRGGLLRQTATPDDPQGRLRVSLCRDGSPTVTKVHVIVAAAFLGERPDGLAIRHLDGCATNNVAANLVYGTPSENQYDRVRHGTHHEANKQVCDHGHPFDAANTYVRPGGGRDCRTCRRDRNRRYRARHATSSFLL